MRRLLLLFVLSVGTLFSSWGPNEPPPPETLDLRLLRTFSAQELYTMMQRELEFYVNDKSTYPLKTQWYTHPVLYSVLREYTIEKETYDFNIENSSVYGEILEERIQRVLEKDERTLKNLILNTAWTINIITSKINTEKLISYIEKHEIIKELGRDRFLRVMKTLQSKLYGDWETYIQNLLTLYSDGSFAGVYGYSTAELFAESGDPRCVEKLELAAKRNSYYEVELEVGKFLVANGGVITEDVIEKALDYSHDRVCLWGARKICEMKIKRLYPKVKDFYNRAKSDIFMAITRIKNFPYWIPPNGQAGCTNDDGRCERIPEDALPLDGL